VMMMMSMHCLPFCAEERFGGHAGRFGVYKQNDIVSALRRQAAQV